MDRDSVCPRGRSKKSDRPRASSSGSVVKVLDRLHPRCDTLVDKGLLGSRALTGRLCCCTFVLPFRCQYTHLLRGCSRCKRVVRRDSLASGGTPERLCSGVHTRESLHEGPAGITGGGVMPAGCLRDGQPDGKGLLSRKRYCYLCQCTDRELQEVASTH